MSGLLAGPTRPKSALVSALAGALCGAVPFLLSLMLAPNHRSPYLWAYPAVILSAWVFGLPGAIACATVASILIEQFMFSTHQVNLAPSSSGWAFRESLFLFGSVFVGALTTAAARSQQRHATADLTRRLALAQAEREAAAAAERESELNRENQVRLGLALDGANAGVWEWNIRDNTSAWSSGFFRLHDLSPELDPPTYALWRACVHPDDVDRVERDLQRAIDSGGQFDSDYRVLGSSGSTRWIACQGTCELDSAGRPLRMVGFCGDITRRKQAELALLQNEKLAVAGRLATSIAHEINNPLEATMNLLYLARTSPPGSEEVNGYVDSAFHELTRVAHITQQTLRFSRRSNLCAVARPSELVTGTTDLLRAKLQSRSARLVFDLRDDPPFFCCPGEIQQILTNIIGNAIDAIHVSGVLHIRVSASRLWSAGGTEGVRITIADDGCGMPAQVLRRIEEPFFTTKEGVGTGLGMWVVSQLIAKHRGSLGVRSRTSGPRQGTTMSVVIPLNLTSADLDRSTFETDALRDGVAIR